MPLIKTTVAIIILAVFSLPGCSDKHSETTELKHYPLNSLEGLITQSGRTVLDTTKSADGNVSLRINATEPTTVRLFETGDLDVENTLLIYSAKIRTEDVQGKVYLEMWCDFPGKGEFFSRAIQSALSGTNDWTSQQTPFVLKKGQNPENIKMNLVIDGEGTVWIDDVRLTKGRLP